MCCCHGVAVRVLGTRYVLEIVSESPDLRLECNATNAHSFSLLDHVKLSGRETLHRLSCSPFL